eukprot:9275351-Pyramimonas_sp.AAC.1
MRLNRVRRVHRNAGKLVFVAAMVTILLGLDPLNESKPWNKGWHSKAWALGVIGGTVLIATRPSGAAAAKQMVASRMVKA